MGHADYRKHNDRSLNSSTYHKKDGTSVRAILKRELAAEMEDGTTMPYLGDLFTYQVQCFDCDQRYEQTQAPAPHCCGSCGSKRVGVLKERKPKE